jgi:hypothetical protein
MDMFTPFPLLVGFGGAELMARMRISDDDDDDDDDGDDDVLDDVDGIGPFAGLVIVAYCLHDGFVYVAVYTPIAPARSQQFTSARVPRPYAYCKNSVKQSGQEAPLPGPWVLAHVPALNPRVEGGSVMAVAE